MPQKAKDLIDENNFEEAVLVLQQSVEQNPDDLETSLLLSGVLFHMEKMVEAKQSLAIDCSKWPSTL